ncbi:adenosine deaminase [Nocardia sp. NBC_01327]|uniref:adenosine deaminase n=1 Tax=Nocardia sp. NBC_01327 TaxID=2903593 RepID=UPI002E0FB0B9|nr:adenosine deaminase [Nocardia sp. NBC_01327]
MTFTAPQLPATQPLGPQELAPADYLRRMPKIELHCHLEGSVPVETARKLARRNNITLPSDDPDALYRFADLEEFLITYQAVSRSMVSAADFALVAYDCLAEASKAGNLRYREMAFNPTNHPDLSYRDMLAGLTDGLSAAATDFGVDCRLIVAVNREHSPGAAADLLRTVAAHRSDHIVGVGLDHNELVGPPEAFQEAFAIAARLGLHRTAHSGERGDHAEITTCIDVLGVERIDHGYAVLDAPAEVRRSIDAGIHYATCWETALFHVGGEVSRSRIGDMIESGLSVSISSDDPPMLHTDIGTEYVRAGAHLGWTVADAEQCVLDAVDATFLAAGERAALRSRLVAELAEFRSAASATAAPPVES